MDVRIAEDWKEILAEEFSKPYFEQLTAFVKAEYAQGEVFPKGKNIFRAFDKCPFDKIKVVIIGQDPYHGEGQAHGLCFSVQKGVEPPPSLKNMFKELNSDIGRPIDNNGNLEKWAKQGVLLLNAVLTVRESEPTSHKNMGWEIFTDRVIEELNRKQTPVVFLLWGAYAQKKAEIITNPIHKKLMSVHPSPLSASRGFLGCRHFSKTNKFLKENGRSEINWQIPNI